jgi:Ca2+-binding RTX toxin-like protein
MSGALRIFAALTLVAAVAVVRSQPASAVGDTCTYDPSTKVVTVVFPATGDEARLVTRSIGGTAIEYEDTPCSTATVKNTKTIDVIAGAGSQTLVIDLEHGPFAPGVGAESSGVREIEWRINLGGGTDYVHVTGSDGGDFIRFDGSAGLELNSDGDVDARLRHIEQRFVAGGSGNDRLLASPATPPVFFYGAAGNDLLVGGDASDRLDGIDGADTLRGRRGNDILRGDDGADRALGGAGNDRFHSGAGNDVSVGGPGDDDITGGRGADTIYGRAGNDTMHLTDGEVDDTYCGGGADVASDRDPIDTVLAGCETT